jgi:hypothetical protein
VPVTVHLGPWTTVQGGAPEAALGMDCAGPRRWNAACTMIRIVPRSVARPLVLALALAGCEALEPSDDVPRLAATRSAEAVAAKTNFALVAERFAGDPLLATMTVDDAREAAVALLAMRLGSLAFVNCDPQLETDPVAGTVDASVVGCNLGLLRVDGEMHAQVTIETAPCDTGECPSAVVWTLSPFELEIGTANVRPHLSGTVVIRDPLDPALPMRWSTQDDFVLENRFGAFQTRSEASWWVTDDRCVEGMQLEARLDRVDAMDDDPDADLEPKVGQIVVSAQDVARCPGKCATDGAVRLAFGRGRVLEWDFDGQTIDVALPGGHEFTATLVCNE